MTTKEKNENARRIQRAHAALKAFQREGGDPIIDEDCLTDLLADLRHLAADIGLDFEAADATARQHFEIEAAGGSVSLDATVTAATTPTL